MKARFAMGLVALALALALGGAAAPRAAEPVTSAPVAPSLREFHSLHGGFWRPAGSDAVRPALRLDPVVWTPAAID